ncbi:MAG: DUF488 family protein [Aeromicrobium sp.]|nr:MAG: DUF488 family protein [Aeromicrobium sp.]
MRCYGRVKIGRIYDEIVPGQRRFLVDRLWPRGIPKGDERVGSWLPQVAPSAELRTWFHADESRFDEFRERYLEELALLGDVPGMRMLRSIAADPDALVVTAAKHPEHSHVPILAEFLHEAAEPVIEPAHSLETIQRWVAFGGTVRLFEHAGRASVVELYRCDGGELVESFESDDARLTDWVAKTFN